MTIFVKVAMQKGNQGRKRVSGFQTHGKMRKKRRLFKIFLLLIHKRPTLSMLPDGVGFVAFRSIIY